MLANKGFANDNNIEHHAIQADLKQFVKHGKYHVQHDNSIDSRLLKWIEYNFQGVSTKYLQKYLNWFRAKERLKKSKDLLKGFTNKSLEDITSIWRYRIINQSYQGLIDNTRQN